MRIVLFKITVIRTNGRAASWSGSTKEAIAEIKNPLNKSVLTERADQEASSLKKVDFNENLNELKNAANKK